MSLLLAMLAIVAPWAVAMTVTRRLWDFDRAGAVWAWAGYGFVLGMLLLTLLMRLSQGLGMGLSVTFVASALAVSAVAGLVLDRNGALFAAAGGPPSRWTRLAIGLLLAWLVLRAGMLGWEVFWRPVYPWDAWISWAVKARTFFAEQAIVPFVSPATWREASVPGAFTAHGFEYPIMVPLIQAWTALVMGQWHEAWVNVAWWFAFVALCMAIYGQLRLWGLGAGTSLLAATLVGTLPMLDTHVALAGYADLWIGLYFTLAFLALVRWQQDGDRRQMLLFLLVVVALPMLKEPGMLSLALLLLPALLWSLSPRWAWALVGTGVLALVGGWATQLRFELPGLGMVAFDGATLALPNGWVIGAPESVWRPLWRATMVMDNWHLLVPLVAAAMVIVPWRMGRIPRAGLLLFVVAETAVIYWTVFASPAVAQHIHSMTVTNRAMLHFLPVWLLVATMVLFVATPPGEREPARAAGP